MLAGSEQESFDMAFERWKRVLVCEIISLQVGGAWPCAQVQFSYVRSIRDKLVDVIRCGSFEPAFVDFLCPATYDALLTLSRDAGGLLRHSGTCCVRSVADVLEIDRDRLLVMVATEQW